MEEKNALAAKLAKMEVVVWAMQQEKGDNGAEDKKKRHRRTAGEIERSFACPVKPCQKSYGSEGSLSQHLKLKHIDYYKHYTSLPENADKLRDDDSQKMEKVEEGHSS